MLSAAHSQYQESSLQLLPLPESWTSSPTTSGEENRPPYKSWLKTSLCCSTPILLLPPSHPLWCLPTHRPAWILHRDKKKKKKKLNLILCVSCKMPHHGPEAFKMPLRASLIRSITIRVDVRHEEEAARKWPKRQFDCKNTGQLLIKADVGKVRRTQDLFQCYFYPPCVVYH